MGYAVRRLACTISDDQRPTMPPGMHKHRCLVGRAAAASLVRAAMTGSL